jgi:hypothetical protein
VESLHFDPTISSQYDSAFVLHLFVPFNEKHKGSVCETRHKSLTEVISKQLLKSKEFLQNSDRGGI